MYARKFKEGDVVELNSGGPPMVVEGYHVDAFGRKTDIVQCAWNSGLQIKRDLFPEACLRAGRF